MVFMVAVGVFECQSGEQISDYELSTVSNFVNIKIIVVLCKSYVEGFFLHDDGLWIHALEFCYKIKR